MKFTEVVNNLFFGCVDASFYEENHIELEKTNYTLLKRSVTFSTGMCLFLFLITLPNNSLITQLKYFYLFFTFFYCVLSFLTLTYVNKHRRYIRLFYYIFALLLYLCTINLRLINYCWNSNYPRIACYNILCIFNDYSNTTC